jgi:hypothetical protein
VRRLVLVLPAMLIGCPGRPTAPSAPSDPVAGAEDAATHLAHLLGELQDDILTSYDRDDPPDFDTGMIVARVGGARIGAGLGDFYVAGDLARAPRWPLDVDRSIRTGVRSKRLEIQIAADQSAAWMSDELSWRITTCKRLAVIPLRITALYAHDGDRWVPVFEHMSFGSTPTPIGGEPSKPIKSEVVSGDLRDELSGVLARGLFRVPRDPLVAATDPAALVLGPDMADEWRGAQVMLAQLPAGKLEDRRVGTVGRSPEEATIAYWVGNYVADIAARPGRAAGKVRMRVTFVFEKRRTAANKPPSDTRTCARAPTLGASAPADCRWMLVQAHMSQPIADEDLTRQVFGEVLRSYKPLEFNCPSVTAPGAALRPGAGSTAGATP